MGERQNRKRWYNNVNKQDSNEMSNKNEMKRTRCERENKKIWAGATKCCHWWMCWQAGSSDLVCVCVWGEKEPGCGFSDRPDSAVTSDPQQHTQSCPLVLELPSFLCPFTMSRTKHHKKMKTKNKMEAKNSRGVTGWKRQYQEQKAFLCDHSLNRSVCEITATALLLLINTQKEWPL